MKKLTILSFILIALASAFTFRPTTEEFLVSDITEFNTALTKVKAGDAIVWKDGKYTDIKISFNPKASGTAEKPIEIGRAHV